MPNRPHRRTRIYAALPPNILISREIELEFKHLRSRGIESERARTLAVIHVEDRRNKSHCPRCGYARCVEKAVA